MSNYDGIQFERVRRLTDPPIVRLKERLDAAFYGDVIAEHPELAGQFDAGKHRYMNGWKHGVSHQFVARRNAQRPLIVFDIRPANPSLTRKAVWNAATSQYDLTPLPLSPAELHARLSDFADQMLAIRWKDKNDELPEAQRYPDIDDDLDGGGQPISRKARAQARLATHRESALEIDDTEAS